MKALLIVVSVLMLVSSASAVAWEYVLIGSGYADATAIVGGNISGDLPNLQDAVGVTRGTGEVIWWSNNDVGGYSWTYHLIGTDLSNPDVVAVADLTSDGIDNIDVIASYDEGSVWIGYENVDGDGSTWVTFDLPDIGRVSDICPADVDNDGYMDLVCAGVFGGSYWVRNVSGNTSDWEVHEITPSSSAAIKAVDMNNDGFFDVVIGMPNIHGIKWFEYIPGDPVTWAEHAVTTTNWDCYGLDVGYIDSDMDLDIVGIQQGVISTEFAWWENNGGGSSWTKHNINNTCGSDVDIVDIDNDGYNDLLGSIGDNVYWWANDGSDPPVFTETYITWWDYPYRIDPCDIDNDGDMDIFGVARSDGEFRLCIQSGSPIPPDSIEITLTPAIDPLIVPRGGTFEYAAQLVSHLDIYVFVNIWTYAVLPNGNEYGPIWQINFPMGPNTVINATGIYQTIPMVAPLGMYQFGMRANFGGDDLGSVPFDFEVVSAALSGGNAQAWTGYGYAQAFSQQPSVQADLPVSYEFANAHPNPFNEATTLTVALPDAAELNVKVYNVSGQQVAELANGRYSAGAHTLTFDASNLASGLYFVRAVVPGELDITRKVVLVR